MIFFLKEHIKKKKKTPGSKFSLPVTLTCFCTWVRVAVTLEMEIFKFKSILKDELRALCTPEDWCFSLAVAPWSSCETASHASVSVKPGIFLALTSQYSYLLLIIKNTSPCSFISLWRYLLVNSCKALHSHVASSVAIPPCGSHACHTECLDVLGTGLAYCSSHSLHGCFLCLEYLLLPFAEALLPQHPSPKPQTDLRVLFFMLQLYYMQICYKEFILFYCFAKQNSIAAAEKSVFLFSIHPAKH